MALDHPYHTLYSLIALRNGNLDRTGQPVGSGGQQGQVSQKTVDMDKASSKIWDRVFNGWPLRRLSLALPVSLQGASPHPWSLPHTLHFCCQVAAASSLLAHLSNNPRHAELQRWAWLARPLRATRPPNAGAPHGWSPPSRISSRPGQLLAR
jgi:hypothetical protein